MQIIDLGVLFVEDTNPEVGYLKLFSSSYHSLTV